MMKPEPFHLGRVVTERHVAAGLALLRRQVGEQSYGFRCLDLKVYRGENSLDGLDAQDFWERWLSRDLLYNYRSMFYNLTYEYPKTPRGVRKFNFTSAYAQVVYYSIGFLILELIEEHLEHLRSQNRSHGHRSTFYGGRLNLAKPAKSLIFYQNDYTTFHKNIKQTGATLLNQGPVGVVQLDVQNFYPTVPHRLVLSAAEKYAKPSVKKALHFHGDGSQAVSDFLYFMNGESRGLPLSRQNLVSNFLAHISLLDLDDFVFDLQLQIPEVVGYHRYVDDFFLLVRFSHGTTRREISEQLMTLSGRVSDWVARNLDLVLNPKKNRLHIIANDAEFQEFLKDSKFVSFFRDLAAQGVTPQERLNEILTVVTGLRENFETRGEIQLERDDERILKECFRKGFKQYVESAKARSALQEAFSSWRPVLTHVNVKALMFLLGNAPQAFDDLVKYLQKGVHKRHRETHFCFLLEAFLHHDRNAGQIDSRIRNAPKPYTTYFRLIKRMLSPKPDQAVSDLPFSDEALVRDASLGQQVKQVVLAEAAEDWNLAFNHLLNSLHVLCMDCDPDCTSRDKYGVKAVLKYLEAHLRPSDIKFVAGFFDRRNRNTISHPGHPSMANWSVLKREYHDHRHRIGRVARTVEAIN